MNSKASVLDEDSRQIIKDNNIEQDDYIIYLVCLILVFAFYFWLTYAISRDLLTGDVLSSTAVTQCFPGQCPTDQKTGEKICPQETNDRYAYDITTQVCNYPGICQRELPYAINSNGSSNLNGICQADPSNNGLPLDCRCSKQIICPDYVLASFQTINGNPFSSNTNTEFSQNLINTYGGSGNTITLPNTGFCQVPLNWLLRSTPGCVGVQGDTDYDIAKACLSLNPCLQGILAYISNNASLVTSTNISQLPVACVRPFFFDGSISCDIENGYIPIYDILSDSVICKLICDTGYDPRYNGGLQSDYTPPGNYGCYPVCTEGQFLRYVNGGFVCQ